MRKQALENEGVEIQGCLGPLSLDVTMESTAALQAAEVDLRHICSPRFLRSFSNSIYTLHWLLTGTAGRSC